MTHPHANLLFDSLSPNTGDIAIGIAGTQVFEALGVQARDVDPFSPDLPARLVVGGGDLIRPTGDDFYDRFRPRGPHILNAAGVWDSADDLGYLNDYAFVSARSEVEAAILRRSVDTVSVVPCTTTLLRSEHYEIPGVEAGETLVGVHVVPHTMRLMENLIQTVDAIPHKKVFFSFTHYNGDGSFMRNLPFDRRNSVTVDALSPLQLHSLIGQLSYAFVSSLHASIFAYSQNVPFVSVNQLKVMNYFQDRGLQGLVVRTDKELRTALERLRHERPDFSALIKKDRADVLARFSEYATLIEQSRDAVDSWSPTVPQPRSAADSLLLSQARQAIGDRDAALAVSEDRRLRLARRYAFLIAVRRELRALLNRVGRRTA